MSNATEKIKIQLKKRRFVKRWNSKGVTYKDILGWIRLYKRGYSTEEIAKKVGVCGSLIRRRLREVECMRSASDARKLTIKRYGCLWEYKYKFPKRISMELAYIMGAYIGDGCKTKQPQILDVCDKDFVSYFRACIGKYGPLPSVLKTRPKVKNHRERWGCVIPKQVVLEINKYTDGYTFPIRLFKSSKEVKCSFIRGLFDAEGSHYSKGLIIQLTDENILKNLKVLLQTLGISPSKINIPKKQKPHYKQPFRLMIGGLRNVQFYEKYISFTIGRKRRYLIDLIKRLKTNRHHSHITLGEYKSLMIEAQTKDKNYLIKKYGISNYALRSWLTKKKEPWCIKCQI